MNIRAVIIDDEEGARESLRNIINQYYRQIEIIAMAHSADTGYHAIMQHQPDLVFLDIEMPGSSAFDLLERFKRIPFDIIFITAYDQYAINAIKYSALDYILKPVDIDELGNAIQRHQKKNKLIEKQLRLLMDNLQPNKQPLSIAIPDNEGLIFIAIPDIIRCESDGNYTHFFLKNNQRILASRTLGEFEDIFDDSVFCRIHRSHLINIEHVRKYVRGEGGYVVMSDGSEVEVSRRKKADFLQRMQQH